MAGSPVHKGSPAVVSNPAVDPANWAVSEPAVVPVAASVPPAVLPVLPAPLVRARLASRSQEDRQH